MNKKKKIIIGLVVVVILVVGSFLAYNLSSDGSKNTAKSSSGSKVSKKNGENSPKDKDKKAASDKTKADGKDSKSGGEKSNSAASSGKNGSTSSGGQTSTQAVKPVQYKGKVVGYIKDATVGCWTTVKAEVKGKADPSIAFFQVYDGSKPISKVMNIDKGTSIYPSKKVGDSVTIKLFNKGQKYVGEENIKYEKLN